MKSISEFRLGVFTSDILGEKFVDRYFAACLRTSSDYNYRKALKSKDLFGEHELN